jgi:ferredoxin
VRVWDIYILLSKVHAITSSNCYTCRFLLQDSSVPDVTHVGKQKLKSAFEQLKTKALQLNCWDRSELEGFSSAT